MLQDSLDQSELLQISWELGIHTLDKLLRATSFRKASTVLRKGWWAGLPRTIRRGRQVVHLSTWFVCFIQYVNHRSNTGTTAYFYSEMHTFFATGLRRSPATRRFCDGHHYWRIQETAWCWSDHHLNAQHSARCRLRWPTFIIIYFDFTRMWPALFAITEHSPRGERIADISTMSLHVL